MTLIKPILSEIEAQLEDELLGEIFGFLTPNLLLNLGTELNSEVLHFINLLTSQTIKDLKSAIKYVKKHDLFLHCLLKKDYIRPDLLWKIVEMEWNTKNGVGEYFVYRSSHEITHDSSLKLTGRGSINVSLLTHLQVKSHILYLLGRLSFQES